MTSWTPTAEKRLEAYLIKAQGVAERDGVDAAEVAAELRAHVIEAAEAEGVPMIDDAVIDRILVSLGELELREESDSPDVSATSSLMGIRGWPYSCLILFGVLLPIFTLVFEAGTGFCAEALFDPTPTWIHVLLERC